MSPALWKGTSRWLRALRDCGALRLGREDETLLEMFDLGWADFRRVPDSDGQSDWYLTAAGTEQAERLQPPR